MLYIPLYTITTENNRQTNTFQGALITDGRHSYTVFIYMCGLLAYGNLQDAGIGVYSENATLVNLNRIVNTLYYAETLACANLPNEWNTLVYALAEPIGRYKHYGKTST